MSCRYIFVFLIFFSQSVNAQTPTWAHAIGGTTNQFSTTVKVAPNGNVCIAGQFSGTMDIDPGGGVTNITSNGADDIFLACYTSAGALLWGFSVGGPNFDGAWYMTIDRFNNVFICGHFQSANIDFDPGAGFSTLPFAGGTGLTYEGDGFLAKYSPTGVFQWAKAHGGPTVYDITLSLGTDFLGNVYCGGVYNTTMVVSPTLTFQSNINGTAYLIKYDGVGNLVWAHNYGLPGIGGVDCFPRSLQVSGGFIYVTGYFQGTTNFSPWATPTVLTSSGTLDPYLAKYDTACNLVYVKQIACSSGNDNEFGSLALDASDNVYLLGWMNAPSAVFNTASPATTTVAAPGGGGNLDIIMAKFNSAGVFQWGTIMGGPGNDIGHCINASATDIMATGEFRNTVDFDPSGTATNLTSSGNSDIFIARYDQASNLLCAFRVGSAGANDIGYGITHDPAGDIYGAGQFGGTAVDFDPGAPVYALTSAGGNDAYVARYTYTSPTAFAGNMIGDTVCTGAAGTITVNVTAGGPGPYTITYSDGTSTHTATGVTSGTPITVVPIPATTTTYSVVAVTNAASSGSCIAPATASFGTAIIVVAPCNDCDSLSLNDSLHLCINDTATMPASLYGTNVIRSMVWSPATGLSSTSILNPVVTALSSGWYYLTIQSVIQNNLVVNGDFSSGNTGFSSSYGYTAPPAAVLNEGFYSVHTNPNGVHSGFTAFGDHTSGTGGMLILNGGSAPTSVWCQTIPVTPNTDYDFSAWFANCSASSTGVNAPILQFMVNSTLLGTPTTVAAAPGTWVNFFATWNSGANTSANICIYDNVTTPAGNDFVIDDITFQEICRIKDSTYLLVRDPDTVYQSTTSSACFAAGGITLTGPTGYNTYNWSTGSTAQSILVNTTGNTVLYSGRYCAMRIDTFHAVIKPTPAPPSPTDTFYCKDFTNPLPLEHMVDSISSLNWYSATGAALTAPGVVNTSATGIQIWYVSQTVNGCESDSVAIRVDILPIPAITIHAAPSVCQYDSINISYTTSLSPLTASRQLWSLPVGAQATGTTQLTDAGIQVRFDSAGKKIVSLTASFLGGECAATDTALVAVIPTPVATAYAPPYVCLGDTVTIALSSRSANATDFAWMIDGQDMWSSTAINIVSANSNSGGPYKASFMDSGVHIITMLVSTAEGCVGKPVNDTVQVYPSPDATFTFDGGDKICIDDSVLFLANDQDGQYLYNWMPEHAFNNLGKGRAWGRAETTDIVVTLTVTDPLGCRASFSKAIPTELCCTVGLPSAFTPNGDGLNDVYRPVFAGYHRFHIFRIDNRWGQPVFESSDNNPAWDGTFNGIPQEVGVYFYYIKYDCGKKLFELKGDVTLLR